MLDGNSHRRLSVKRNAPRQHFKHCNAKRIDIALFITVAASGLLRRCIMNGTHDVRRNGIARCRFGNTEIRYFDFTFFGNDNILRLYVAVNDMVIMCRFDSHGNLNGNTDRFLDGQSRLFLNIFFQGDPFHQFHDDIVDAALFPDIINIDDIRMHQTCCGLRFYSELGNKIRVFAEFLLQHLDRYETVQFMIFCFIYIRHTACTDLFQDLVPFADYHSNFNHVSPHLLTAL